jgi:hypothetical protein
LQKRPTRGSRGRGWHIWRAACAFHISRVTGPALLLRSPQLCALVGISPNNYGPVSLSRLGAWLQTHISRMSSAIPSFYQAFPPRCQVRHIRVPASEMSWSQHRRVPCLSFSLLSKRPELWLSICSAVRALPNDDDPSRTGRWSPGAPSNFTLMCRPHEHVWWVRTRGSKHLLVPGTNGQVIERSRSDPSCRMRR